MKVNKMEKLYNHYIYSMDYYKQLSLKNVLSCFVTIYSRVRGGWSHNNSLSDLIFQLQQLENENKAV